MISKVHRTSQIEELSTRPHPCLKNLAWGFAGFLLFFWLPSRLEAKPGLVYLVLGSDTALWNAPGGIAVAKYRNHFDGTLFTSPETNAFRVIDPAFRSQFIDSFGQPLKMTWWLLVGSVYGQSDNLNVPVPNLMPLYLMRKYHGETLRQLGDEVSLHYHTFLWSDYNGDGVFYWNEARTFHECREDWDLALAQSLIEEQVFPVSFRSGWHYMDNEWQQYLNQLLPYNMDNDSPNYKAWSTNEPAFNVQDWSQASTEFIPFQPSTTNYQVAGVGSGWNVRSVKFINVTQELLTRTFDEAAAGVDQVVSLWGHLAESDFATNIAKMHGFVQAAADAHPAVAFHYCTAVEAMQRWLGNTNEVPPDLVVSETREGASVRLAISSSKAIFQSQPFVAVKDLLQHYTIEPCLLVGPNQWSVVIRTPLTNVAKIGVAITDLAGNLQTRILRHTPEEIYLDNLDSEYHELAGAWTNSASAAWGTNSRVALLNSNGIARVSWTLPVVTPASYHMLLQFPDVANLATNIEFTLKAGNELLWTNRLSEVVPGKWLYLSTAFLDPKLSNSLEMLTAGNGWPDSIAAADVLKLSTFWVQTPDRITDVAVDPDNTTANVTWTTSEPCVTFIKYGADATLGRFSSTNYLAGRKHVRTLSGLTPAAICHFQINADGLGARSSYEGVFQTISTSSTLELNTLADNGSVTFFWNGTGSILQRAQRLEGSQTQWEDLPVGTVSPFSVQPANDQFYRLKQ